MPAFYHGLADSPLSDKLLAEVEGHPREGRDFTYSFNLVAPALQLYKFKLFSIIYDIRLYPVQFVLDADMRNEIAPIATQAASAAPGIVSPVAFSAASEEQYLEKLKLIFNSERTRAAIHALLAQSENVQPTEEELPF